MATPGKLKVSPGSSGGDALPPGVASGLGAATEPAACSRIEPSASCPADSGSEPDVSGPTEPSASRPAAATYTPDEQNVPGRTEPSASRPASAATPPAPDGPDASALTEPSTSRPSGTKPDVTASDDSPDSTVPQEAAPTTAKPRRRTLTWAAGTALAAATAFAAWSAWSWHAAANAPTSTAGATRDEAVTAGRTLITTVTTFDPQHRDQALALWQSATTGALQTSLPSSAPSGGSATTGRVLDAGLSDLDAEAGTAKLLASVEITVTKDGTAHPVRRTRLAATMTRTASGWKLSSLEQLGVAGS